MVNSPVFLECRAILLVVWLDLLGLATAAMVGPQLWDSTVSIPIYNSIHDSQCSAAYVNDWLTQ
jgi:hypothetical protein